MKSKRSSVYVHREFSKNCALISPKDLYAVLTLNWLFDAVRSGLPPELVEKIYDDHHGLQIEAAAGADDFRVLYVSVDDAEEPADLLRIIAAMNPLTQMSVSVYCSQRSYTRVKDYANQHIRFVCKKEGRGLRKPVVLHADLVITFGPGALHFIRQGIPVMIIGPHGFGGMVSPEFLPYLLRDGFMGRPGGAYGELIPAVVVQEELMHVKIGRPSPSSLQQLKELASELPFCPLSACDGLVSRTRQLQQRLYDKEARGRLIPKIASNVEMVQKDELTYVRRIYINDTLAVVNAKKLPFFHKIDAATDGAALYAQSSLSKDDFWKYIYTFWEKKIIVF